MSELDKDQLRLGPVLVVNQLGCCGLEEGIEGIDSSGLVCEVACVKK